MNPKFLIIVPTLNSYSLLPRFIQSLKVQSMTNWDVLFIDGPSLQEHRRFLDICCNDDSRFRWIKQSSDFSGIFGAMSQGFLEARRYYANHWILFWGSDDWAASSSVLLDLAILTKSSSSQRPSPDIIVCRGQYVDSSTYCLTRPTVFNSPGFLTSSEFRYSLFLGKSPPHQSTLFSPNVCLGLDYYESIFLLSADLDYFLRLSKLPNLIVQCSNIELVHIADGGVSGRQTQLRLTEVLRAYYRSFGLLCLFPFVLRYLRRIFSLLSSSY